MYVYNNNNSTYFVNQCWTMLDNVFMYVAVTVWGSVGMFVV